MRLARTLRYACAGAGISGLAVLAMSSAVAPAASQSGLAPDGRAGFVVSSFSYVLSQDASETGACPQGMAQTPTQIYAASSDGQRTPDETADAFARRIDRNSRALVNNNGENICLNPDAARRDPFYRTVTGGHVQLTGGIDLDGQDARINGRAAPGTCAHDDFHGVHGEHGVDNQFFRAIGCIPSYQPDGQSADLNREMLVGEWGALITLSGVDDVRNDASVEVGIYANVDPIQVSADRTPLANASYSADRDPRFRATAHGRIVNGVLTTDPVDVRFHFTSNGMYHERPLRDARLRLTWGADGALDGVLAGYTPVEEAYDLSFGYRTATTTPAGGELAPLRLRQQTAVGRSILLGYTCPGVYNALLANADGHRDPATGRCTSISTQYHIRAIPAFVVE